MSAILGAPLERKDGRIKVTGRAMYGADHHPEGMAYAWAVPSTIASGKIERIDDSAARQMRGFLALVSHENVPSLHLPPSSNQNGMYAEQFLPLQSRDVYFYGQDVAFVVAETLEAAEEAAGSVRVSYVRSEAQLDMEADSASTHHPLAYLGRDRAQKARGEIQKGLDQAEVRLNAVYRTSFMNHNPMETHAAVADWRGEHLTVYESTQWVMGLRGVLAKALGLDPEAVRVISPFVGGGFGSKGFVWPHSIFAAVCSRQVGRPVKLVRTRAAMFMDTGHRGQTRQAVEIGSDRSGKLGAIRHNVLTATSLHSDFFEPAGVATPMLYSCPNIEVSHKVARLNTGAPTPMRAPGESTGTFALESAMDELAVRLGLDPIELRLRNYAAEDEDRKAPFSSKHLRECYERGAHLFGWPRRTPTPGSMRSQGRLIGWGMATATYPANQRPAKATVTLFSDGRVLVRSATQDLGTGTYTTLAQVAADALGIDPGLVRCEIGDSSLPPAGVSGGSSTSASVTPAVHFAALDARQQALKLPGGQTVGLFERMRASAKKMIVGEGGHEPEQKPKAYSAHSFGAQFAEVSVEPRTRQIRVERVVTVIDAGRILNRLTATSQIQGGVVWGISMALLERTHLDERSGAPVTRNLADYLVAVNADVPDLTVEFVEHPDYVFNSLGVRGIGEIGITGITAAIANAVYHASGVRVRDLPITLDRLLV